jgi:hypothetical protein
MRNVDFDARTYHRLRNFIQNNLDCGFVCIDRQSLFDHTAYRVIEVLIQPVSSEKVIGAHRTYFDGEDSRNCRDITVLCETPLAYTIRGFTTAGTNAFQSQAISSDLEKDHLGVRNTANCDHAVLIHDAAVDAARNRLFADEIRNRGFFECLFHLVLICRTTLEKVFVNREVKLSFTKCAPY